MYKLVRWINQNTTLVVIFIIVIVLILAVIYTWNSIMENRLAANAANQSTTVTESSSLNAGVQNTNVVIMTQDTVSSDTDETNTNMIANFVKYCNEGQVEEAYNMLSDECKELIYPSLEDFTSNYYEKIFYITRAYDLETWYSNNNLTTYYISYTEDILSTGTTTSSENRGDYITVEKENNNYYLNISSYVGREEVQNSSSESGVTITINYLDMYIDYTIANITVKNSTNNKICMDTKENSDTIYLYDENEVTYTSFLNEIADEQLCVVSNASINVNIKFNKIYNPSRALDGIYFKDIVLNYEEYSSGTQSKEKIYVDVAI